MNTRDQILFNIRTCKGAVKIEYSTVRELRAIRQLALIGWFKVLHHYPQMRRFIVEMAE